MTSKERIYKILNFQRPDRIGIHDTFLNNTIEDWRSKGLPRDISVEDYFGFDLNIFDIEEVLSEEFPKEPDRDKFLCLSFSEPFQRLCDIYGREDTLRRLAHHPEQLKRELADETERILGLLDATLDKGITFDGAWVWGDLAYNKGLFFSPSSYETLLFRLHKKIFRFLDSRNLFTFFHSDGKMDDLIPYLLEAGVKAIHPLEENSGMDIDKLLKDYKEDMVFMGCINIERLIQEKNPLEKLRKKIDVLKNNCSYIYHADHPIMPNITFEYYNLAIETVRRCGAY